MTKDDMERISQESYELPNNVLRAVPSPVVSVRTPTYNHGAFIQQCIESVLAQKTEFPIEYVIGEDFSTDPTRGLVFDYAGRYPDTIRVITADRNVGSKANGYRMGAACRGKYIAWLDGDDYWTDPRKLQKQVDFLEAHPECSMCFHRYETRFEDGSSPPHVSSVPPDRSVFTLKDLLRWDFVGTLTVMFRRRPTQELPDWYYELPIGDWPLHILNAQYGDIGYIDSVMAVHRVHGAGMWSSASQVKRAKAVLQIYQHLRTYLGPRYQQTIKTRMARAYLALAAAYADEENIGEARQNFRKSVGEWPVNEPTQVLGVMALALRLYTPRVYSVLKSIWRLATASL